MNKILSLAERRALKARAHPLKPTVMIGNDGLSASVLQEIDSTLKSHELIKIKVDHDDSDEREDMLGLICASTGASAIDHIGKMLVVYRERPQSAKANAQGAGGQGGRANNAQRNKSGGRNGGASAGQPGQAGQGQGADGQRKSAKAGAVWTKVRQQRGRKGGGGRSGPGGGQNRGQGGNRGGGDQGGGNRGGGSQGGNSGGGQSDS